MTYDNKNNKNNNNNNINGNDKDSKDNIITVMKMARMKLLLRTISKTKLRPKISIITLIIFAMIVLALRTK